MEALTTLHLKLQDLSTELEKCEAELAETKRTRVELESKAKISSDDIQMSSKQLIELTKKEKDEKKNISKLQKQL